MSASDLFPASYSTDAYNLIGPQDCDDARGADLWYTCKEPGENGPFMGCCTINPCQNNGTCPPTNLVPAKLSSDATNRVTFVSPSGGAGAAGSSGLPTGAVVGIVLTAVIILVVVAVCIWRLRGGRLARRTTGDDNNAESVQPLNLTSPPSELQ